MIYITSAGLSDYLNDRSIAKQHNMESVWHSIFPASSRNCPYSEKKFGFLVESTLLFGNCLQILFGVILITADEVWSPHNSLHLFVRHPYAGGSDERPSPG